MGLSGEFIKNNPRERLKEKHPLDILEELQRLINHGYELTSEDDLVRLQWYGLYHDKPRRGHFMLRIRVSGGILRPHQLRVIGTLAKNLGDYAELTMRQDIQLHWVRLEDLPRLFSLLKSSGLTTLGGCGDTIRNITGCPVAGIDRDEIFDTTGIIEELEGVFNDPAKKKYFNLPRKFKITLSACPYHCNHPEMHDLSFVGTLKDNKEGFAIWIGGGLSSTPRLARPLGLFVTKDRVAGFTEAVINLWSTDAENRRSFVKARLKHFIERIGLERFKELLLKELDFTPEEIEKEPGAIGRNFHSGINKQKQEGYYYVGFPVDAGVLSGTQLINIAELSEELNLSVRLSQRQNFILSNIPEEKLDYVLQSMKEIGFGLSKGNSRFLSVACTGDPFCNYSFTSSKELLLEILEYLEKNLGEIEDISIGVDGCPHACCHHWLNDVGLQSTRVRNPDGSLERAVNIIMKGGYGQGIGRIIAKKVSTSSAKEYIRRLIHAYKSSEYKDFREFIMAYHDEDLLKIMEGSEQPIIKDYTFQEVR